MANPVSLSRALAASLRAAALLDADLAAVALAKRYAKELDDDPELIGDLGPKLLATLNSLGLTPQGRGVKGVTGGSVVAARLDEFTARRARKHTA